MAGKGFSTLLIDALVYRDGRTFGEKLHASACPMCHVLFLLPEVPDHNCEWVKS